MTFLRIGSLILIKNIMIGINTFVTFPILIKIFKLSLNYI